MIVALVLAVAAAAQAPAPAVPPVVSAKGPPTILGPPLGIVWNLVGREAVLARLDPATLVPGRPRLRLGRSVSTSGYDPLDRWLVLARNGDVGLPVSPAQGDFFQIATQLSLLEVVLDPDPPTLRRIQPGQPALVVMAELGGDGMSGVVKAIQGNQAVVAFTSSNSAVKPGMTAQVRIKTN